LSGTAGDTISLTFTTIVLNNFHHITTFYIYNPMILPVTHKFCSMITYMLNKLFEDADSHLRFLSH
jgi:hypothetical protein